MSLGPTAVRRDGVLEGQGRRQAQGAMLAQAVDSIVLVGP